MADEPENLLLIYMRRLDAKMDRIIDDMADVKTRLTNLEEGQAVINRRLDRIEARLDRVERRLDLVDVTH